MIYKIFDTPIFFTFIAVLCVITTYAQASTFNQIGKVRPIVSEAIADSTLSKTINFKENLDLLVNDSKIDFYLYYEKLEKGVAAQKWVKLPDDRNWSSLSNQIIEVKGNLNGNKLTNINITQHTKMSESYLTDPPPTNGLYKTVAVPLTIQPQSSQVKSYKSNATAEEIHNVLYNDPKSLNNFYEEASYGTFGFTGVNDPLGDVVPVTIQATVTNDCQNQIISEFTPIVQKHLLEQNIDTSNGSVDLGIIIFNDLPQCPPYPFATRGALGQKGVPLWLWMPESWFVEGPAIMSHEIGHEIGGNHTASMRCKDFDDQKTCVINAGADDRDIMTFAGRFPLMPNNYERLRWGWHPPESLNSPYLGFIPMFDLQSPVIPHLKEGNKQGRFFFRYLSGVYAGGWAVFPESRRNWGRFERYDANNRSYNLGVAVRIGHSDYGHPEALSLLLDANETEHLDDAPLLANQSVSIGGVEIKCTREYIPFRGTRMRVQ